MRVGPERVVSKLEEVSRCLTEIEEEATTFLKGVKDRVEAFHRSAFVISFKTKPFTTVHAISPSGETITAQTLSDPFDVTPSPFKKVISVGEIPLKFEGFKSGVMEFPPRTRFLALIGSEAWISKIKLYEDVKGLEFLSFAFKIDDEIYSRLESLNGSVIGGIAHLSLDDEGLNVVVSAFSKHVPLLAEMAKVLRDHMKLKASKYSKLPRGMKVLTVFRLDLEEVLNSRIEGRIEEFVKRLKNGYEGFIEGAGLS